MTRQSLHRPPHCAPETIAAAPIVQRAATKASPRAAVPPVVHEVLRSPGQPLDAATRADLEPRFGQDFSGVRVHSDTQAAQSAQAVNALAYTVGRHVVFGAGQYTPNTRQGQHLLAHELAHVIQQRGSETYSPSTLQLDESQGELEEQARRHGEAALDNAAPTGAKTPSLGRAMLQRQKDAPHPQLPQPDTASAARTNAAKGTASQWSLADLKINFEISNQKIRDASFLMVGTAATGAGFTDWSNKRVFSILPPEHAWLHTTYWVDTAEHPLPPDEGPVSVTNDIKFITDSGQTTVDAHYADQHPKYEGAGRALNPTLGRTSPAARDLPVYDLPLNEGGVLQWRAGFGFVRGGTKVEVRSRFQVQRLGAATPQAEAPTGTDAARASKGQPLPTSPTAQQTPEAKVGEIQQLTELIKRVSDAATRDPLVKKLRDLLSGLQPVMPAQDAQKTIDDAIKSLVKDGTDAAIMAILKAITGKSPATMPENRTQIGPNVPQRDLRETVIPGPKFPIKDAPALPPQLSFQYKNGPRKSYEPGAAITFTIVPPENFATLQGAKRVVIVAAAERDLPNAERLANVVLEKGTATEVRIEAPTKPGQYVIRVDIGLGFDYSNMQEFEVTAPSAK